MPRYRRRLPLLLLVLCTCMGMISPAIQAAEQAYSVPVSDNLVRLEIQMPDGRWVKGMVQEGDQFRTHDHERGLTLAFVPFVHEEDVSIRVLRINKYATGDESIHFIEEMTLPVGDFAGATKKTAFPYPVKVLAVQKAKADEQGSCWDKGNPALTRQGCCVRCGANTNCGCAVEDTCGSCCAGPCCRV